MKLLPLLEPFRVRYYQFRLEVHLQFLSLLWHEPQEARRLLDRLEIHYTPKHGSWLNIAEIELRILNGQCLNRRIPDKGILSSEVAAWQEKRNSDQAKVDWQFTAEDARIKLKRLYPILLT